jgi:glycosyltransferase involved in cell wall biosynthesis
VRILAAVHGYPPELEGGTERVVQAEARALAALGHDVTVVAGTLRNDGRTLEALDRDPASGAPVRVIRLSRTDLHAEHWQKSLSAAVSEAFRAIVREVKPDVLHVHHWLRLSRELVAIAAGERVPAIVTLHDAWTTCLIAYRLKPDTPQICEAAPGAMPCLGCAQKVPPRTPFVPIEAQFLALHEHKRDLLRELTLARALLAPSRAHGEGLMRFLGDDARGLAFAVHGSTAALPRRDDTAALPRRDDTAALPRRDDTAALPRRDDTAALPRREAPAGLPARTSPQSAIRLDPPERMGRLVLGAWGQLSRLKGSDLLLEALHDERLRGRVVLHLAGTVVDPVLERRLPELLAGLDVRLHGPYRAEELGTHEVSRVHAFVSAARARESYGLVLDEASALGLASVLPRHPAFEERTGESRGTLFFEPGDARSLAGVLTRLATEDGLASELAARTPAIERTPADAAAELVPIYTAALAAGAPAFTATGDDWFAARMRAFAESEWDRNLASQSRADLGFDEAR